MINEWFILGVLLLIVSILANAVLISYIRTNIVKVFVISEELSEIFTRLDSFQEHLKTVYDLPTFYGDETLSGLLEHSKALSEFILKYEDIYSFTQPDLLEQLEAATVELQEKHDQKEAAA
tara:strand:- start:185 stop:547 length:363 start_codon:yes stop_codon:yes gene_type:complete